MCVSVTHSCPTLCDPMDCSLPGSSGVHRILHARILEWVAILFSRGIFLTQGLNPGLLHCRQILYHLSHQGSPIRQKQRSSGERNGNPFQYSCLENPMDGGAWQAIVHGVAKESDMTEVTEHGTAHTHI